MVLSGYENPFSILIGIRLEINLYKQDGIEKGAAYWYC